MLELFFTIFCTSGAQLPKTRAFYDSEQDRLKVSVQWLLYYEEAFYSQPEVILDNGVVIKFPDGNIHADIEGRGQLSFQLDSGYIHRTDVVCTESN